MPGSKVTPVSWEPDENLGEPEWLALGRRFGQVSRCSQWWVGDWLNYGDRKWGKTYSYAARVTGYDVRTLRNIAYVSGRVKVSLRSDALSFSHHALVAAMESADQVRWLQFAAHDRLSVEDLRSAMRSEQRAGDGAEVRPPADQGGELAGPRSSEKPTRIACPHCGEEIPYQLIEEEYELALRRKTVSVG